MFLNYDFLYLLRYLRDIGQNPRHTKPPCPELQAQCRNALYKLPCEQRNFAIAKAMCS